MSDPSPASASVPSLARRGAVAGVLFLALLLVWVVVPAELLARVATFGVQSSLDLSTLVVVGTLVATLGALRSFARPTRAFGPVAMLASAVSIGYLVFLSGGAHLSINIGSGGQATVDYGRLLLLLAAVPAFGFAAGIVATVEDLWHPDERVRATYPPRGPGVLS